MRDCAPLLNVECVFLVLDISEKKNSVLTQERSCIDAVKIASLREDLNNTSALAWDRDLTTAVCVARVLLQRRS